MVATPINIAREDTAQQILAKVNEPIAPVEGGIVKVGGKTYKPLYRKEFGLIGSSAPGQNIQYNTSVVTDDLFIFQNGTLYVNVIDRKTNKHIRMHTLTNSDAVSFGDTSVILHETIAGLGSYLSVYRYTDGKYFTFPAPFAYSSGWGLPGHLVIGDLLLAQTSAGTGSTIRFFDLNTGQEIGTPFGLYGDYLASYPGEVNMRMVQGTGYLHSDGHIYFVVGNQNDAMTKSMLYKFKYNGTTSAPTFVGKATIAVSKASMWNAFVTDNAYVLQTGTGGVYYVIRLVDLNIRRSGAGATNLIPVSASPSYRNILGIRTNKFLTSSMSASNNQVFINRDTIELLGDFVTTIVNRDSVPVTGINSPQAGIFYPFQYSKSGSVFITSNTYSSMEFGDRFIPYAYEEVSG